MFKAHVNGKAILSVTFEITYITLKKIVVSPSTSIVASLSSWSFSSAFSHLKKIVASLLTSIDASLSSWSFLQHFLYHQGAGIYWLARGVSSLLARQVAVSLEEGLDSNNNTLGTQCFSCYFTSDLRISLGHPPSWSNYEISEIWI